MSYSMAVDNGDIIYHPQKTENYKIYLCCIGLHQAAASVFVCPACLFTNQIYEGSDTYLSQDGVHVTLLWNDFLCHLASTQVTIPFDKITDVQMSSNCCYDLCGLRLLDIQTAGAPTPEGRILFVEDVPLYREKILEMKREGRLGSGDGGGGGLAAHGHKGMEMREENFESLSPIQKIRTLKEYADLGILTQGEYETLSQKVMMSDAYHQQKKRIMDQL